MRNKVKIVQQSFPAYYSLVSIEGYGRIGHRSAHARQTTNGSVNGASSFVAQHLLDKRIEYQMRHFGQHQKVEKGQVQDEHVGRRAK
jgi:hypothetical protein